MPRFDNPISCQVLIMSALLAVLPGVNLAQDRPGVALPPPSLYDDNTAARPLRAEEHSVPTTAAPTAVPPPPTATSQPAQAVTTKPSDLAVDSANKKPRAGATGQCHVAGRQEDQVVEIGAGQAKRLLFLQEQVISLQQFHSAVTAFAVFADLLKDQQIRRFGQFVF